MSRFKNTSDSTLNTKIWTTATLDTSSSNQFSLQGSLEMWGGQGISISICEGLGVELLLLHIKRDQLVIVFFLTPPLWGAESTSHWEKPWDPEQALCLLDCLRIQWSSAGGGFLGVRIWDISAENTPMTRILIRRNTMTMRTVVFLCLTVFYISLPFRNEGMPQQLGSWWP